MEDDYSDIGTSYNKYIGDPLRKTGASMASLAIALNIVTGNTFPRNAPIDLLSNFSSLVFSSFLLAYSVGAWQRLDKIKRFKKQLTCEEKLCAVIYPFGSLLMGAAVVAAMLHTFDSAKPLMGVPNNADLAEAPYYIQMRIAADLLNHRNAPVEKQMAQCRMDFYNCTPEKYDALKSQLKSFEEIGIDHDRANLYRHMANPYRYPDVPKPYQRVFQPH